MTDDDHKSDCATHNDPYLPRGECDCGADTRRKAAEEWVDGAQESEGLDAPAYCDAEGCLDDGIFYALENAHLAGQECGEKRAAAEIAALREEVRVHEQRADLQFGAMQNQGEELGNLREAIKDFLCECALVDKMRQYETWQITPGSMDELRKMVEETP